MFLRVNGGTPRDQNDRSTKFDLVFFLQNPKSEFQNSTPKLFPFISWLLSVLLLYASYRGSQAYKNEHPHHHIMDLPHEDSW